MFVGLLCGSLLFSAPPKLVEAAPAEVGLDPAMLARIDAVVANGLRTKRMPGCVVLVARHGKIAYFKAFGNRAVQPQTEAMTKDTIFDLASVTKPTATACSVMLLVERGLVRTTDRLADHLPGYLPTLKEGVTIAQLLTHTAGFIPDNPISDYTAGERTARDRVLRLLPNTPPGERFIYSDVGFQLLGELVLAKTGQTVADFAKTNLFEPLGMTDTMYNPPAALAARCAPTEERDGRPMRGTVHDPRAYALGGVAGHAGLFGTATDLAVFGEMLHGRGSYGGVKVFGARTVELMTRPRELPGGHLRCLGWDMRSSYSSNRGETLSDSAFGHGGFTGTAFWIDPELHLTLVFLSNRVHPDGKGFVNPLIGRIGSICGAAVMDDVKTAAAKPAPIALRPPTAPKKSTGARRNRTPVLTGVDVLERDGCKLLAGKKVALITNHTGRTATGKSTIDVLHGAKDVKLVALFSPEHGIRGELDEKVGDGKDAKTGLPIFSLYGDTRKPSAAMLQGVDTLVYDIQDVGARFYTYISTLGLCLEAAAERKLNVVVLDRPNPIGGVEFGGPLLDAGKESFVAYHRLPIRHGLTVGELATMFKSEKKLNVDLTIVKVKGWRRADDYDATGLTWINPSPNMRCLTQAYLYPGIGLLETTNLSVGRGTDTPFEIVGAPWLDGRTLAAELNGRGLSGVTFAPVEFTPTSSKFKGQKCGGVRIAVIERAQFEPLRTGLAIAVALRKTHAKQWETKGYGRLLGHAATLAQLEAGKSETEILALWKADVEAYRGRYAGVLLYE